MLVRDDADVVTETLESVATHVAFWVVVDTGSTDGTAEVVRSFFRSQGIPGELHHRPWRDFGTNRSEALELCRGRADYTWVIDADDLVAGTIDLSALTADCYLLRYGPDLLYWRPQLFRSSLPWRFEGVVHEHATCEVPASEARLEGDYHVESRRLGNRSRAADTYARDCALLLDELGRDPGNARNVFYLAQSSLDAGDPARALAWYSRRAEMGGFGEEVFYSLLQRARLHEHLGQGAESVHAYLEAWQARPARAEPLYELARRSRVEGSFDLAYLFAAAGCELPFPQDDRLFVSPDVYSWRLADERSIAAYYTGRFRESFDLCTALLDSPSIPEDDRERALANRDFSALVLKDETLSYPEETIRRLARRRRSARPQVTLTITACRRPDLFEQTVNSFLNCCDDVDRIGRWICIDDGSSPSARRRMQERYPFFEFVLKSRREKGHARSMNLLLGMVTSPYWLHLEDDWHFFVRAPYVQNALAILRDDAGIGQVLFNRNYGETLECRDIRGGLVRRTEREGLRYRLHAHAPPGTAAYERLVSEFPPDARTNVWWPHFSLRPSLVRTAVLRGLAGFRPEAEHFELDFAERYAAAGNASAFLDAINCLHIGKLTWDTDPDAPASAYELNREPQFGREPRAAAARRAR